MHPPLVYVRQVDTVEIVVIGLRLNPLVFSEALLLVEIVSDQSTEDGGRLCMTPGTILNTTLVAPGSWSKSWDKYLRVAI